MTIKAFGIVLSTTLFIAACGADQTESDEGSVESSPGTDAVAAQAEPPQETPDEEPVLSEFLTTALHEAEPTAPGMFRLEVSGEVHEGEFDHCWITEGDVEDRFEAGADWESPDGRHFDLKVRRLLRPDEDQWRILGYEFDQVSLRLHDGSGHFELRDQYAASGLQVHRDEPGSDPGWAQGSGELPVVRISADGGPDDFQVTAAGDLQGAEDYGSDEYGTPLTGPFTLTMQCER